ncbi:MAG TPA: phosphoribosyltransferase family protein [Phycisphaerae bacterium]|nr:phosphoribosyltransferase family protein [Phycisphaerae bacterium]
MRATLGQGARRRGEALVANDIGETLISAEAIAERVSGLGAALSDLYAGREPVIVAIMKGCVPFLADLVRAWPGPMHLEFMSAESYHGTQAGEVRLSLPTDFAHRVAGRHVLVVDDIYDTGATLTKVCGAIAALEPADLRALVLLRKRLASPPAPSADAPLREPDWVGFDIEDRFVIGYGLDYNGLYRNLPYLAALRQG